jgi:transcriptional regulator with XRE-family HTH domain
MPRPAGHRLSPEAFDDVLRLKGLSLTQAAQRSETPRPTLSSLLGGHSAASVPTAHRIAGALGVNPITLFPSLRDAAAPAGQVA